MGLSLIYTRFTVCLHTGLSFVDIRLNVVYLQVCHLWLWYRTIPRDSMLVTEEYPMISPLLLALVHYVLHKAPYWSIHKNEDWEDESLLKDLLEHVEKVHRDNLDELEGTLCTEFFVSYQWSPVTHHVFLQTFGSLSSLKRMLWIAAVTLAATRATMLSLVTVAMIPSPRCPKPQNRHLILLKISINLYDDDDPSPIC